MKAVSIQDALTSHFCSCGNEVKEPGERCEKCKSFLQLIDDSDSFWGKSDERNSVHVTAQTVGTGLLCKGGCGVRVHTHKGMGGWCGDDKNGCRRKEIDRRRAEAGFVPRRQIKPAQPVKQGNWLEQVSVQISDATDAVRIAQEDLDRARGNLEQILRGALETLEKEG